MESIKSKVQKEKKMLKEGKWSLRGLWDMIQKTGMHMVEVPKGRNKEKEAKRTLEEIIAEIS